MTCCAWGCVQRCDLWAWWRKEKKGQKLLCVKLAICPYYPCRHGPFKFCIQGRVWELVIYFKFHENRSRGLGAVEGRKTPSSIDKAHRLYNSLYYCTSRDSRTHYCWRKRRRHLPWSVKSQSRDSVSRPWQCSRSLPCVQLRRRNWRHLLTQSL